MESIAKETLSNEIPQLIDEKKNILPYEVKKYRTTPLESTQLISCQQSLH